MTPKKLKRVEAILQRMEVDLTRATRLAERVGREILNEDQDDFWALVKYMENVQDGIVQLDNINKTVFPELVEFPEKGCATETSWKSLKGMRSRLAHAFDNINHEIVWSTVKSDFPRLAELLKVLHVGMAADGGISFNVGLLRSLPHVKVGEALEASNSIPTILFHERGYASCVRIGMISDSKIVIVPSKGEMLVRGISLVDPKDNSIERLWPR